MNIVSLIADQVQTRKDLFRNEGRIMDTLMNSGFRLHEADAALTFMQSLVRTDDDGEQDPLLPDHAGMRAMSTEERARFTIEAFAFVSKLAILGVITEEQRETLLERAMTLHRGRIGLEEVKSLTAYDLFADSQEHEDQLASALERKGSSWN